MIKPLVFTDAHCNTIKIEEDEVIFKVIANEDENTKRIVEIHISIDTAKCVRNLLNEGLENDD